MIQKKRIAIAEDHTILREGLCALFNSYPEYEVICEAEDGLNAVQLVLEKKPDILLLDLTMPKAGGLEVIKQIKKQKIKTKIIILTVHREDEYIFACFEAGADAYIQKAASHTELVLAIKSVLQGKRYLSPEISTQIIQGYLAGKKDLLESNSWNVLTAREREILKLVAEGYRNKEIAKLLYLSVKTVEKHRANLMKKLDLHNASALTTYAAQQGLIP
jgi:two-component system response regulator NreC